MALRPQFKKTVFDNGLTLLTERHPEFRSLSIGFWVKAGTRHEAPREAGLSHFLEHMLFKGTESRSALDIARAVDQVGGEFNAFTAREHTCFHILLLDRDIGLGLDILSDVILNSDFDAEELERERKVILQEISMVEESPEELVHDLFFELAYGKHGLGKSILGSEASVKRTTRAELLRFFRKHYRPEKTVISIAGNISHEMIKKKLRPLTQKRWPGRPDSVKSLVGTSGDRGYVPAPSVRSGAWWIQRPTEQVHLVWGVEGLSYSARDRFASFLLNTYLGGGMSSSLFQEIREKNGLAYTVYSSLSAFSDSGVFSVYSATGMSQVPLCLRLIEECVGRLKEELLSKDELQVIKDNVKGTVLLSSDSVESRMTSIAKSEIFHREHVTTEGICKMIDAVTPEDVRRVARKLLMGDRRSVVALGGRPPKSLVAKLGVSLLKR
jgi:predicted Zn-dependent peptidase